MLRFLHTFTVERARGNFAMYPGVKEDKMALEFATFPVDSKNYWTRAFEIIKRSKKFNNTDKMKDALVRFVDDLKIQNQLLSAEKKQQVLNIANSALETAFQN